ncbi:MAG: hypothetical protein AAGA71_19185 [Pseudomonadota bacterium]
MSEGDVRGLSVLLAELLGVVSQQFFHMITLQRLGHAAAYRRIREVDDVDFKTAMKIVDALLPEPGFFALAAHSIRPEGQVADILGAELAAENRFACMLESMIVAGPVARELVDLVKAPRASYRKWLEAELESVREVAKPAPERPEVTALFTHLLQLMEQTLINAMAWHRSGHVAEANTTWQISGASMVYLRELAPFVPRVPSHQLVVPILEILSERQRFFADIGMVRDVMQAVQASAADGRDPAFCALCARIAEDCALLLETKFGEPIRATLGYSPVFVDFDRAVRRMNSSARQPHVL